MVYQYEHAGGVPAILFFRENKMKYIRQHARHAMLLVVLFVSLSGLAACGGGTATTTPNASLSGTVVDGRVSGATLTLYSDLAMTTQVGTGSTDTAGAFTITLTVATAPDPIYIKATGGTDLDTGMPAPTMMFVGNTTGANALTSFNVTPLTKDVFERVGRGDTLAAAQTNAQTAFGLAGNTGTNGLYEDPSLTANAGLKTAAFKKLTAGTTGGTVTAGNYKIFAITVSESDVTGATALANTAALVNPANGNFVDGAIAVAANGDITGTTGGNFITGKVVGSSVVMNIVDSTTAPTTITRVVGNLGLNGSMSGNYTDLVVAGPTMTKGLFVGTLIPTTGINAAGLATFVSSFYSPGVTSGLMNIVARDIFTTGVPRVNWGRAAVTAVNVGTGSVTMGSMTLRTDAGSLDSGAVSTLTFGTGTYVISSTIPTNLLVFTFTDGATYDLYVATAVGLRRGIYFIVPRLGPSAGKITQVGESYMSKVDSVAPNPFALSAVEDITIANIHPGMPGLSRTAALAQGLTPQIAGPMTLPAALTNGTIGNGFWDTSTGSPELMVFQGSMFVMKKDANDNFAENILTSATDDHLRVVEFYESGAIQGEEIMGGTPPGGLPGNMRDYPSNFIGFVHDQASTATPSFTGTLNFLARTIYASSYAGFSTAYNTGTLTITTAPTATTAGSATLVATPAGGTASTSTLSIDAVPATKPGVYHINGAMTGGDYVDIVWPIGGTKALYAVSASATGTVSEVGEAFITQ